MTSLEGSNWFTRSASTPTSSGFLMCAKPQHTMCSIWSMLGLGVIIFIEKYKQTRPFEINKKSANGYGSCSLHYNTCTRLAKWFTRTSSLRTFWLMKIKISNFVTSASATNLSREKTCVSWSKGLGRLATRLLRSAVAVSYQQLSTCGRLVLWSTKWSLVKSHYCQITNWS